MGNTATTAFMTLVQNKQKTISKLYIKLGIGTYVGMIFPGIVEM